MIVLTLGLALSEMPRMELFKASNDARTVESGALLFEGNCRACHGPQGKGIEGVAPAINAADLYDGSRLAAVGWSGTTEDYIRNVIAAGRPVPSAVWQETKDPLWKAKADDLAQGILVSQDPVDGGLSIEFGRDTAGVACSSHNVYDVVDTAYRLMDYSRLTATQP